MNKSIKVTKSGPVEKVEDGIGLGRLGNPVPRSGWSHEERIAQLLSLIKSEHGRPYTAADFQSLEPRTMEVMVATLAMLTGAISGGRFREALREAGINGNHCDLFKVENIVKNLSQYVEDLRS